MDHFIGSRPTSSTWVIGDVHGCIHTLKKLIDRIDAIQPDSHFIFVGDLVGKGPHSKEVLHQVQNMDKRSTVVLGNHDLHLLAVHRGISSQRTGDRFDPVLNCKDTDWQNWLANSPLIHIPDIESDKRWIVSHAGFHPNWSIEQALQHGNRISESILGENWDWYRNPDDPVGIAANILTRMRTLMPDGNPDLDFTGPPQKISNNAKPWYQFPSEIGKTHNTISGHWAALGLHAEEPHFCIDTGCVYGGSLTGFELESARIEKVPRQKLDETE